jgi:WXG100 family type VII secretion target
MRAGGAKMATFTDVDTEQIRQTSQGIRQNIENMKRIRNTLDGNVPSRLIPCWQGQAKDLFSRQFTAFSASLGALIEGYEALNTDLEAAGGAYQQANEAVNGQVNRLR